MNIHKKNIFIVITALQSGMQLPIRKSKVSNRDFEPQSQINEDFSEAEGYSEG